MLPPPESAYISMYSGRPPTGSLANRPPGRPANAAPPPAHSSHGRQPMVTTPAMPLRNSSLTGAPRTARPTTIARGPFGSTAGNLPIATNERPMTQHGLGGLKTGVQGPGRLVQDRTYFQTELRRRITLITAEITKLHAEAALIDKENANADALEKRADGLAEELRDLQGQLADLNTLIDRQAAGVHLPDVEDEQSLLKERNTRESRVLDELFAERQEKEAALKQVETLVNEERKKAEAHVEGMDPESRREYRHIKEEAANLSISLQKQQADLDELTRRGAQLESELGQDPLKQRAVKLRAKLAHLQSKRAELESTIKTNNNPPAMDKSLLLHKVKQDNQDIAAMERRIAELEEKRLRVLSEMEKYTDNPARSSCTDLGGDKSAKYEELVKRDKEMQTYLDSYDGKWKEVVDKNNTAEKRIVTLLDRLKNLAGRMGGSASSPHLSTDDVVENTVQGLSKERDRKTAELDKVLQMESKLASEMAILAEKLGTMNADLRKFANVDAIKREAEQTRKRRMAERERLKSQICENETHLQLSALESRVKSVQEEESQLSEWILQRLSESDYTAIKKDVLILVDEINGQLVKMMSIPRVS
ncbi:hypothetical protein SeMB42_g01233 [Synchytrium endobioticum]|uniref:Uncharacterized protein n=1 Tax=Synchytrium endobioticum TaxID=286115 RepID=A0A507DM06_9FUNG|nr:hypothetical protein SeMB42_g01233 [Synchytrium endobioticum]